MLLKYKDAEYNNKIEHLRNNGYTVNFVAFDYDDFIMEEGNPVPFIELQLPNGGKSYNDYTAIVAWSDYLENDNPDEERTHSGMPVPSNFTVQNGDTPVNCYYVIEDTATEGIIRFSRAITDQGPFSNEDFSNFAGNLCGLMFIEGHEYHLDPDVSMVVPNLEAFFSQASGTAGFQLNIANRTRLLSLGDNEDFSEYRYYKIIPNIPTGNSSEILFNETSHCYYTENSSYQLLPLPIEGVLDLLECITEEDLTTKSEAEIYEIAKRNSEKFASTVTNELFGCLHLQEPLIYPVCEPLTLRNNIRIVGNGSTIMAYAANEDSEGNFVERKNMSIITNKGLTAPISNVSFANLTFKGTFKFYDEQGNVVVDNNGDFISDQCIYNYSAYPLLKNFNFEQVTFDGFKYAVHTSGPKEGNEVLPTESFDWSFNNCEFINVETGFMLCWSQGISITNSHISNSLCKDDKYHCIYIARGSSYITVDNCLLENSIGAAIVNSDALPATGQRKMHHNTFTNLQIRNCCIGMIIGSWSEHITVKNIVATNVARAIKLANCTDVNIDNFNATGSFYYEYIRKDEVGDTRWKNSSSEWAAISVWGFADVKITNSFFSTGGKLFGSATSGLMPLNYNDGLIPVNLEFDNCVFITTLSEYLKKTETNNEGIQEISYTAVTSTLGVPPQSVQDFKTYRYDVQFNSCQFYMNSENNKSSMIALYGFESHPSIYNFNDCLIAYRDGNGTPEDDHPDKADSMPDGFFIYPAEGTWVEIENCIFYVNKANATRSSECGFVMNKYLFMDEIESDKERCLIKSYSKYRF